MNPTISETARWAKCWNVAAFQRVMLLLLAAAVSSCESGDELRESHYAVYSAVLERAISSENAATATATADGAPAVPEVIIAAQLDMEAPDSAAQSVLRALVGLEEATAVSYGKARAGARLKATIDGIGEYALLEPEELAARFKTGWKDGSRQSHGPYGVFLLSRIGFNERTTQALVFLTEYHDGKWGKGTWYLLAVAQNHWQVQSTARLWIS